MTAPLPAWRRLLQATYSFAPLLLVFGTLGWAGNTIAGRLAVGEISPMTLIFFRWGLVVLLLWLVASRQIRQSFAVIRPRRKWLAVVGSCICLFNGLFYWAANYTTAINLGIFQATIPAFILIGMDYFFNSRITRIQLAGLLATLVGVVVVVVRGEFAVLLALTFNSGDLLMIIACAFYAAYALGLRARPEINVFVMMWYIAVVAWLAAAPLMLVEWLLGHGQLPTLFAWLLLLYIVIVPSYLSQVLFMRGVDLIGPGRAGLYANLVPLFSAFLGVLLLGEALQGYHWLASFFIFGGIYLFEKNRPRDDGADVVAKKS